MDTREFSHKIFVRLPDIGMSLFFAIVAVLAAGKTTVAETVCSGLTVWFIYEYYGAFFLLLWVALNEKRARARLPDLYRIVTACVAYLGCAALMHFVFRFSLSTVAISAVGGIWPLVNPLVRDDAPTAFQIGRETVIGIVALLLSLILVSFFASIAEQTLPRPFHRAAFDAVTIAAIGAVYYPLRWYLVARFAATKASSQR